MVEITAVALSAKSILKNKPSRSTLQRSTCASSLIFELKMLLERAAVVVAQYYGVNLAYYWYHWALHQPWSGPLYRAHYIGHHKRDFPVATLRRDRYSANGGSGWFENGGELVFGVPVLGIIAAAFWLLSSATAVSLTAVVLWVLITGEVAHSSYHLNDDPEIHPDVPVWLHRRLVRLPFYRKFQMLHDIHHGKRDCNFGFSDFQMDRLFGTYCEECPEYLVKARRLHRDAAVYSSAPTQQLLNCGPKTILRLVPALLGVALFTWVYSQRWDTTAGQLAIAATSALHWRDPRRGWRRTLDMVVVQISLGVHVRAAFILRAWTALELYAVAVALFAWSMSQNSYLAHAGGWVVGMVANVALAVA